MFAVLIPEVTVTIPAETGLTESPVPKSIVPAAPTREPLSLMMMLLPPPPPPEMRTLVMLVILPLESTTICGTAVPLP